MYSDMNRETGIYIPREATTQRRGYVGGLTGGVPEEVFKLGFNDLTEGLSGGKLKCEAKPDEIIIQTPDSFSDYLFKAYREEDDLLALRIITKSGNPPQAHPDLYAAQLVRRSITYFEDLGFPIKRMRGRWLQRDNRKMFENYLQTITEGNIEEKHKHEAARSTWTGKLAQSLGFTEIESLKDTGEPERHLLWSKGEKPSGMIYVIFKKPE
jgi:hypothetical protein